MKILFAGQKLKDNYHATRNWNYITGTRILVEKLHSNLVGEKRDSIFHKPTLYPRSTAPQLPDWLINDRKVSKRGKKKSKNSFYSLLCF